MEKTEIIEGNKLIAEFMGWKYNPNHRLNGTTGCYEFEGKLSYLSSEFKYHSSWDWLMPVVEKIAKHVYEDFVTDEKGTMDGQHVFDTAYPRTFAMINAETKNFMVRINRFPLHESKSLIEATYLAVVEYIKYIKTYTTP